MKMNEIPQGDLKSCEALKAYARKVMYEKNATNFSLIKMFDEIIDDAPTVTDRYDEGFRDGYAQCINDKEERKENNRLFRKGGKE